MIEKICPHCKTSVGVTMMAWVKWNVPEQKWVLDEIDCSSTRPGYCSQCEREIEPKDRPL